MKPLVVPPPTQPVLRTDKFEQLWASGDQRPLAAAGLLSISNATLTVAAVGRCRAHDALHCYCAHAHPLSCLPVLQAVVASTPGLAAEAWPSGGLSCHRYSGMLQGYMRGLHEGVT
jgi:hypothetical protein